MSKDETCFGKLTDYNGGTCIDEVLDKLIEKKLKEEENNVT